MHRAVSLIRAPLLVHGVQCTRVHSPPCVPWCSSAVNLLRALEQTYFKELQEIEVEGEKVPPPRHLPW